MKKIVMMLSLCLIATWHFKEFYYEIGWNGNTDAIAFANKLEASGVPHQNIQIWFAQSKNQWAGVIWYGEDIQ